MLNRPMRRTKNAITDPAELERVIRASPVMRLAMSLNDEPYVIPLSFGYDGATLYFHCATEGLKRELLRGNPRVCCLFEHDLEFTATGDSPCAWGFTYATVIVHGRAAQITDPARKLAALQLITDHYARQEERVPEEQIGKVDVWRIEILEMTGKRAG